GHVIKVDERDATHAATRQRLGAPRAHAADAGDHNMRAAQPGSGTGAVQTFEPPETTLGVEDAGISHRDGILLLYNRGITYASLTPHSLEREHSAVLAARPGTFQLSPAHRRGTTGIPAGHDGRPGPRARDLDLRLWLTDLAARIRLR